MGGVGEVVGCRGAEGAGADYEDCGLGHGGGGFSFFYLSCKFLVGWLVALVLFLLICWGS